MCQVVLILEKLKLFNKLKIIKIKIQFNIMIDDIDKNNNKLIFLNILQLKWILQDLIQKKNYKKILKKIKIIVQIIIKIFINHYVIQLKF